MNILLIGRETSIMNTIEAILHSQEEWKTFRINAAALSNSSDKEAIRQKGAGFTIVIVNLIDFSGKPVEATLLVKAIYTTIPLLVTANYKRKILINRLIKAGATGYLQLGFSEKVLLRAIKQVARKQTYIHTEDT